MQTLHPVVTPADLRIMTPHERAFFTDEPLAHRIAQLDFERDLMREHAQRDPFGHHLPRAVTWALA